MGYDNNGDWYDDADSHGDSGHQRRRNPDEGRILQGITIGTWPAKAVPAKDGTHITWGKTEQKGARYVSIVMEFTAGPNKGKTMELRGYFSGGAIPYTMKTLKALGFHGDDPSDLESLSQIQNEVDLVLGIETNTGRNGQMYENVRIKFVNQIGGGVRAIPEKERVGRDDLKAWAAQMKASGEFTKAPPERPARELGQSSSGLRQPQRSQHPNAPDFNPDDDIPF